MARRKKMRGKEEKKGRGKKRRKGEKNWGQIAKFAQSSFFFDQSEIYYLEKNTLYFCFHARVVRWLVGWLC